MKLAYTEVSQIFCLSVQANFYLHQQMKTGFVPSVLGCSLSDSTPQYELRALCLGRTIKKTMSCIHVLSNIGHVLSVTTLLYTELCCLSSGLLSARGTKWNQAGGRGWWCAASRNSKIRETQKRMKRSERERGKNERDKEKKGEEKWWRDKKAEGKPLSSDFFVQIIESFRLEKTFRIESSSYPSTAKATAKSCP